MASIHIPDDRLKRRLASGKALGCHWLTLGAPVLAELAVDAGAQSLVFDLQHGLWTRASLELGVAAVAGRAPTLARTADASDFAIGSALDAGVQGVIVPMISSAEAAAEVVAAARFPPHGRRSGGGSRPMAADFGAYIRATAEHLVVGVMIETVAGLEAVEAIAATPGLDLVFVGPSDLSLTLGAGPGSEVFDAALVRIRAACAAAGVPVGIYTLGAMAAQRAAEGFRFVVVADDTWLNRGAVRPLWDAFGA